MKTNIFIILTLFSTSLLKTISAQIAIGKSTVTNSSVLLEFGTTPKGIRLNPVENVTSLTASAGTIAFDASTGSFRYYDGTSWSTADNGGVTGGYPAGTDINTQGVIFGASTSSAQGAMILESIDKALVLPRIISSSVIASPPKGLMVYDMSSKTIQIYNGSAWVAY